MTTMRDAATSLDTRGYALLDPLPEPTVRAARRRINEWIAAGMSDPERAGLGRDRMMQDFVWSSFGDAALRTSPEVHACFAPYEQAVRTLIGPGAQFRYDPATTQVALRFPGTRGWAHIDGVLPDPGAEVLIPSTVLFVYLSDVGPDDAPFTVWPRHLATVRDIARRSRDGLAPDRARQELIDLMSGLSFEDGAEPVTGPAGTVILAHPAMPHCNGLAAGPDVRYTLFRRYYPGARHDGDDMVPQTWGEAMDLLLAGPGDLAPLPDAAAQPVG